MSWSMMAFSAKASSSPIGDSFAQVPLEAVDFTAEPTVSPFSAPPPPTPQEPVYEPVDYVVAGVFLFTITCLLLSIIFMALCLVAVRRRSLVVFEDENSLDPATGFHHQRLYIKLDLRCNCGSIHLPLACFGRLLPRRAFPDDFDGYPESHTLTPNERRESLAVLLRKMSRQVLDGGTMSERADCTEVTTTAKARSDVPECATSVDLEECFVKDDNDAVASTCSVEVFTISSRSLSFDNEQPQVKQSERASLDDGERAMATVGSGEASESADVLTKLSPLEETKELSEDYFCHDRHFIQLAKTEEMSDSCTQGGKSTVVSNSAPVWTRSDVNDQAKTDEDYDRFCSICLEEYEAGDVCVVSDSCPHRFHRDCIMEWLMRRNATTSCPCCRKDLVTNEDIERVSNELAVGGDGEGVGGVGSGVDGARSQMEVRGRRRRMLEVLLFPRSVAVVVQRSFTRRRGASSRRRRLTVGVAPSDNDNRENFDNSTSSEDRHPVVPEAAATVTSTAAAEAEPDVASVDAPQSLSPTAEDSQGQLRTSSSDSTEEGVVEPSLSRC